MPYSLIKRRKTASNLGKWEEGKVPARAFPLHGGGIPFGGRCRWRTVSIVSEGHDLRLLIVLSVEKQVFMAVLGEMVDGKLYILASLESHATHPGVHCHASCARNLPAFSGSMRYPEMDVVPRERAKCRRNPSWTERTAWETTMKFYRISETKNGDLI